MHTRAPGKSAADFGAGFDEFPVVEVANAAHVVAHVAHSDGAGGMLEAEYRYAGFAFHRQGRGSLGFAEVTVEDLDRKTRAVTELRQDFPFTGAVARTALTVTDVNDDGSGGDEQLLTDTTRSYLEQAGPPATDGPPIRFACLASETGERYDLLDGQHLATTVTDQDPDASGTPCDAYGSVPETTVTVLDRGRDGADDVDVTYATTTVRTFAHDEAAWLLGQVTRETVSRSLDGVGDAGKDRTTDFTYTAAGAVASLVREPGEGAPIELSTSFGYDGFGNRVTETVTAADIAPRTEQVAYDTRGRFPVTLTNAEGLRGRILILARSVPPEPACFAWRVF